MKPSTTLALAAMALASPASALDPPAYAIPVLPQISPLVPIPLTTAAPIHANATTTSSSFSVPSNATTTTLEVVTALTTWCPQPTVLTLNGNTYSVERPTTLTITDCPCTITHSVVASAAEASPASLSPSPWVTWASVPVWTAPGNGSAPALQTGGGGGGAGGMPPAATPGAPFANGGVGVKVGIGGVLVGGILGIVFL